MSAVLKKVQKPLTIGQAIDKLWELEQEKKAAAAEVKRIEGLIEEAKEKVYEAMDTQGVQQSKGTKASASIGDQTTYNIEDFDALSKYVKKTGYFHLFQRRVSAEAVRELFETKGGVPGLVPFTKRKINLTTVK